MMQPLISMPSAVLRNARGVLTDIDDTLTEDGRLHADVLDALERLQRAGVRVIPVTGRPFGWAYPLLRMWPVKAIVAENGAAFSWLDDDDRQHIRYYADDATRATHRAALDKVMREIQAEVPGAVLTLDHFLRVGDVAFDLNENVQGTTRATIDAIAARFAAAGCHIAESTIHIHGSLGHYTKHTASLRLLQEVYGILPEEARQDWLFIGDSLNDAPMFEFFPNTIGVANVRRFVDRMPKAPAYVTQGEKGRGFIEFANALLAARPIK